MKTSLSKHTIWLIFLCSILFSITSYAAPEISITSGNPGSTVSAPYTFSFYVKDAQGLSSVTVNGRETGPNGTDFYEVDWTTNYNGSFNIVAVNTAGERSLKTLEITNITSAGTAAPAPTPTKESTPSPTQAPPPTQAPTEPTPTPPTQAPSPSTLAPTEDAAPVSTTAASTGVTEEAVVDENIKTTMAESSVADSMEGLTEETNEENEVTSNPTEEMQTIPIETEAPTIPPDSYRLFAGDNQNRTIPLILISGCLFGIIYCIFTLILNKRRLRSYKELHRTLLLRKKNKEKSHHEEKPDELAEEAREEDA